MADSTDDDVGLLTQPDTDFDIEAGAGEKESSMKLGELAADLQIVVDSPQEKNGHRQSVAALDLAGLPTGLTKAESLPTVDYEKKDQLEHPDLAPFVRSVSLDTGFAVEEKRKSVLNGDILSVRQASFEVLVQEFRSHGERAESKTQKARRQSKEEIVVPPRDVLMRMPMYSTPLTLESTNNAYRDFVSRLMGMGFEIGQAECAVVATRAENVEGAIQFIFQHPDGLWHRYKPNDDTIEELKMRNEGSNEFEEKFERNDLCDVCGLQYWKHYLDPNGAYIEQEVGEVPAALSPDPRSSMSVMHGREQMQREIEEIASNRIRMLEQLDSMTIAEAGASSGMITAEESIDPVTIDGPTADCGVCFDTLSVNDFYMASCGHNYCHDCLENHYRIKTRDADVLKIGCIDPGCDREIPEEEVKVFLKDPQLVEKFEKFRKNKLLMLNANARFCVAPNCEGWMIGSRFRPKLECPECQTHMCFNCSQGWHGYLTGCNNNVDVGYSMWALNKDVQKCPKCKIKIEKAEGCNHMTCQSCKYQFCWICRGPYSHSHFEWWNLFGCPGAQYTPQFCRCPACFPRWLNRLIILMLAFAVVLPFAVVFGSLWVVAVCFMFCAKCSCDLDDLNPCDW